MNRHGNGIGVVAAAFLIASTFGAGVAAASGPDLSGQTYGKAAEQISSWGWKPVIASVVGDQLPTDECIVTSATKSNSLDSSGRPRAGSFLLHLNCNQALASPGKAGNSAATPEGRKMKQQEATAENFENAVAATGKISWCEASAENGKSCKGFCDSTKLCSDLVLKYLSTL